MKNSAPQLRQSIFGEQTLTMVQAAKRFTNRPHKNTVRRWCHEGFRGVKLESFYSGASLCTSVEAIERFLAAINPGDTTEPIATPAHEAAEAKLDALGVR